MAHSSPRALNIYDTFMTIFILLATCGGEYYAITGSISSPNYPSFYDNYLDCVYEITIPAGSGNVVLEFLDISLEACCDFVSVSAFYSISIAYVHTHTHTHTPTHTHHKTYQTYDTVVSVLLFI